MTDDWTKEWERRIVNGVYPLRRFLGRSNHSVVFLTECLAQNVPQAAIKILPATPARAEAQLAYWRRVVALSHPHLMRLLDAGRCQLGGHNFLFVVMDLAEQNLAQILPGRPLAPDEVRDLLPATLGALAYLHGQNLVQGGLKPTNFLVVDDQLKLASDTIRPVGERAASTDKTSVYAPPEARNGGVSTAGDMWGFGITLVEALTQTAPAWSRESSDGVSLPPDLAPEFVDAVQRCLDRDPGRRPTIAELLAQFKLAPPATPLPAAPPPAEPTPTVSPPVAPPLAAELPPATPSPREPAPSASPPELPPAAPPPGEPTPTVSPPATPPPAAKLPPSPPGAASPPPVALPLASPSAVSEPSVRTESIQIPRETRFLVTVIVVGVITLSAVWGAVHLFHARASVQRTASITPPSPPVVAPPAVAENPKPSIAAPLPASVLHQEMPDISRSARATIRGVIKIAVRVIVDRSGDVVATTLDHRASSKYFARAALDAAEKWKFAQDADQASRVWLLRFEFSRAGATAHAAALR
jgi:serine/threonine protein kinase